MKLFGQILIVAICVYATTGVSVSNAVSNTVQGAGNVASAAVNAAGNAAAAGVSAAGNIASSAVNVAGNVASTAVNAAGSVVKAGENAAGSIIGKIQNTIHGNSHSPSVPTADTCYSNYNTQLSSVNDETVSQSQSCYTVAQSSEVAATENINATLLEVNTLSQQLQSQIAACAAKSTAAHTFYCYLSTFDTNLNKLDVLTERSQLAVAYLTGSQSEVQITQTGCVSSVIFSSKANSTIALNTLETCLDRASNSANTESNTNSTSNSQNGSNTGNTSSSNTHSGSSSSSSSSS